MENDREFSKIPGWVEQLDLPVWVRDADGKIVYINERAGALLGRDCRNCLGHLCHVVIAGRGQDGQPLCTADCRVSRLAARGEKISATDMVVPGSALRGVHIRVVVIPIEGDEGQSLVHCAFPREKEHRALEYLDRIVGRSDETIKRVRNPLTAREREVLAMLVHDKSLYEIAEELGVSHTTVRNHVQHVLSKLRVHSIAEAVAIHLMRGD